MTCSSPCVHLDVIEALDEEMAVKKTEQNVKHEKSSEKVSNKRASNRSMRRAAKKDPESAPKKTAFQGYTT